MSQNEALQARLAVVAEFPRDYFLENIVESFLLRMPLQA